MAIPDVVRSRRGHFENYLARWDPLGFIAEGAPLDEYDAEAKEIRGLYRTNMSSSEVVYLVSHVFKDYFDVVAAGFAEQCIKRVSSIRAALERDLAESVFNDSITLELEITDITLEHGKKEWRSNRIGQKNKRWIAYLALNIHDLNSRQDVAEWFYIIVCSPSFIKRPFRNYKTPESHFLVTQDELDINKALDIAKRKLQNIRAHSWNEFYEQMEKEFYHED